MLLPKPETRAKQKARERREYQRARRRCREVVYERDGWLCQRCFCRVSIDVSTWAPNFAHVNEIVPRSRGGSATDPANCELLCRQCHLPNGQHAPTAERLEKLTTGRLEKLKGAA